jgi:S1-C subfamily serine protease
LPAGSAGPFDDIVLAQEVPLRPIPLSSLPVDTEHVTPHAHSPRHGAARRGSDVKLSVAVGIATAILGLAVLLSIAAWSFLSPEKQNATAQAPNGPRRPNPPGAGRNPPVPNPAGEPNPPAPAPGGGGFFGPQAGNGPVNDGVEGDPAADSDAGGQQAMDDLFDRLADMVPPGPEVPAGAFPDHQANGLLPEADDAMAFLLRQVAPGLVVVRFDAADGQHVQSGFIVGDPRYIVTCAHTLRGIPAGNIFIEAEGGIRRPVNKILTEGATSDVAILEVEAWGAVPLPLASSLDVGVPVAAVGAPHGLDGAFTSGAITAWLQGEEIRESLDRPGEPNPYDDAGFDPALRWNQTDAGISLGNMGGPLVNLRGEVVGVCGWSTGGEESRSFAVPLERLRGVVGNYIRPLTLPPPPPAAWVFDTIPIPSGAAFSRALMEIPDNWQRLYFPDEIDVFVTAYPDAKLEGVFAFNDALLHGPCARLYDNGKLGTLCRYHEGDLDGDLHLWEKNRDRLLFAQYKRGRKNGFVCLFEAGSPRLVQEWKTGKLLSEHLVSFDGSQAVLASTADLVPRPVELESLIARLANLESEMETGEQQIKRSVMSAYRKMEKEFRAALAARLSARNRDEIIGRQQARDSANAAKVRNMWRASLNLSDD